MNRSAVWAAVCCAVAAVCAAVRAAGKPFWYDELFTFYVTGLGSFHRMREAVEAGLDLNPPMLYLFTTASRALFGDGLVAVRLPGIVGFAVLTACVYRMASRRMPGAYAVLAAAMVGVTGAFGYAYEARAYGLLLGFAGMTLAFRQSAADGGRGLAGMALSLAGALLTHCYAVLLLPPLYLAEALRTWIVRQFDWRMWAALVAPLAAIVTYLPLLRVNGNAKLAGPIFDPAPLRLVGSYLDLLAPALPAMGLGLAAIALARRVPLPDVRARAAALWARVPADEWVLFAGLAAAPALAYAVSVVAHGGYFTRYGLPAAVAIAAAFPAACFVLAGEWRGAWVLPAFALGWMVWGTAPTDSGTNLLAGWDGASPLVVLDGQTFLEMDHRFEDARARQLVFLLDREAALRFMGTDCYDAPLRVVPKWFPVRGSAVEAASYLPGREHLLVYGLADEKHHWLLARMREEGAAVRVLARGGGRQLVEVTRNQSAAAGERSGPSEANGLKSVEASKTSTPSARLRALTTR
ncbi:MAG: glycosyltransferase family 39 protein [Bryobacteraceae bacterium]